MGRDVESSHSSSSASRHKEKLRSSRNDKGAQNRGLGTKDKQNVAQSRGLGTKDKQNVIGQLDRWPHDKFLEVEHPNSGVQGYHSYRDRHRYRQEDDFMDQRRQERERIGLIGVMQVWGKSPPVSEELVFTVVILLFQTENMHCSS
jgi:hypothetical protein